VNPEGSHPEYFEELCALAAGGQIAEPEFVELRDHLERCARCRSTYADFIDLVHHKLPLADLTEPAGLPGFSPKLSSYRDRFLARARKQGLAVSRTSWRDSFPSRLRIALWPAARNIGAAALAIGLLLAVGVLSYSLHQSNARVKKLTEETAIIRERNVQARENQAGTSLQAPAAPAAPAAPLSGAVNEAELVKARQDHAAAEARSRDLEAQLQAAALELESLKAQHDEESGSRNEMEKKLAEAQLSLARAGDELQSIRQQRAGDAATVAAQAREIRELSAKLSGQTEALVREAALLTASRDIRDLMGARNLHIVDVLDVDSKGKDRRAFGRVFYTEEKSLIFYAFDLGDRAATRRNASFQVWGARGPAQNSARSLGIFYVDDQKQNRWVLKFEDPRILAEIDSVYVTVEPQGGSARPTGRKFLYAYLKANPNHP
jgi:hypothetical protein